MYSIGPHNLFNAPDWLSQNINWMLRTHDCYRPSKQPSPPDLPQQGALGPSRLSECVETGRLQFASLRAAFEGKSSTGQRLVLTSKQVWLL